ncbi:hypothetical protein QUF54_04840 [Candidatus Marithioploca araucensis]|uniref:Anaphase-promoting complex subunit 4-like WD40 domain-containing protein n=1 Tax=Candidatus Marithioploca araucensis TaxID=70273 RepID=A0ABT7VSX9_9GAMM|nr:hypothetical protein [Candidatus Marithioploca araucensis]
MIEVIPLKYGPIFKQVFSQPKVFNQLASYAEKEIKKGNLMTAMLLALEALPKDMSKPDRPYVVEAKKQLFHAVFKFSDMSEIFNAKQISERFILAGDSHINHIAFSPDGKMIVTAEDNGNVNLWNANNGQLIHSLTEHEDSVSQAVFSPDSLTLATSSWNEVVYLWNVDNGKRLHKFNLNGDMLTFSPDGLTQASMRKESIFLWNIESSESIELHDDEQGINHHLAINPNGRLLAVSRKHYTLLWNL